MIKANEAREITKKAIEEKKRRRNEKDGKFSSSSRSENQS